jgi:hypothetical protein
MLQCIRYHKNSCGRFEKFNVWSLPSWRRGDIITGNTKYIKQYVKRFSNLNVKTQSLILIANHIIAFSCFTINVNSFFPNCSVLERLLGLSKSMQKARALHLWQRSLSFWFYTNLSVPYSLGRLKKVRLKAESG